MECYCSHSVCLSVYLCSKNFSDLWTLALWKYYQQTSNHTRFNSNNRLLLKLFCFKVMTIFVSHGRCFTTFRRRLVAKSSLKHTSCLKPVELMLEIKSNSGNNCHNIDNIVSFLPWQSRLLLFKSLRSLVHMKDPCSKPQ